MKHHILSLLLVISILCCGCRAMPIPPNTPTEMRGIWVSFLDLDPLLQNSDPATAAKRLDSLLDTCRDAGMNTVFFHVRAHGDAYYPSAVFPPATSAAHLLAAGFDPLAYAVNAAHARGLQLHAWINPYRIGEDASIAVCEATFEQNDVWYYNPADDTARAAVIAGVRELLTHYAVDGIHFDDYFYPSGMPTEAAPFETVPDGIAVGDWRRAQVDSLVSAVHGLSRAHERVFGISPTALPHTDRDRAYADTAMWLATAGYVDYLCPQIYFGFSHETHAFESTLATWESLPRHDRVALYIGLALYKSGADDPYAGTGNDEWVTRDDILMRQVMTIRAHEIAKGFILFRYAHLLSATEEMANLHTIL